MKDAKPSYRTLFSAKNIFFVLFIILIIAKVYPFHTFTLDTHFNHQPIVINLELVMIVFAIAAGAIFVRRGSNDCWFIALNFVVLILVTIVLEWYQPGLGIAVFILMVSTAVAEELLVRYALFEVMSKLHFKPAMMVLVSALIFMAIHTNIYTHYEYSLMVFATGLVLATIYLKFRQNDQAIKGIVLVSWMHLIVVLTGIYLSLVP